MSQMFLPQCVMTPAGMRDLEVKVPNWLHTPEAEALRELGVQFGIQLVGKIPSEVPKCLEGIPVAIHAYNFFVERCRQIREESENYLDYIDESVQLWRPYNPMYIVFHAESMPWTPSPEILDDPIARYQLPSEMTVETYSEAVMFNQAVFHRLRNMGLSILLENVHFDYFTQDGSKTYFGYWLGTWVYDTLDLAKRFCCGVLCDIEHLALSHNILYRIRNHADSPPPRPTAQPLWLCNLGWLAAHNEIPWAIDYLDVEEAICKMGAKYFHVAGGVQAITDGRASTHAPISIDDSTFRYRLRAVLECEPITICTEVAGASGIKNDPFWDRRPELEVQEESWKALLNHLLALYEEGALPPR